MTLFISSLVAGALTALAPCILPLLPVVLGGSITDAGDRRKPLRIVLFLSLSVFVFTFLLKASTVFIMVPEGFWRGFAALIIAAFGLTLLFPVLWERVMAHIPGVIASNKLLASGAKRESVWGDFLMALALGPIFSTCSPTYFVILATVLPVSYALGALYVGAYVLGLAVALLIIAYAGQRVVDRLALAADPHGWFKRTLGLLFVALSIVIIAGWDRTLQIKILDSGVFDVTRLERAFTQSLEEDEIREVSTSTAPQEVPQEAAQERNYPRYREIVNPSGFVNSEPFKLADYVGKKVILIDFLTYSCINCQRTFPYINSWHEKYADDGLLIVGIHTPEFAFERDIANVREAAARLSLKHPLVLDNEYATWNAYGNRYWPRKYLIDIRGNIVYDHIGEGSYEETEQKIMELLKERKRVLGETGGVSGGTPALTPAPISVSTNPETYFGALRNSEFAGNVTAGVEGEEEYLFMPKTLLPYHFYVLGRWRVRNEYVEARSATSSLTYVLNAGAVHLVAGADAPSEVEVFIDGAAVRTVTVLAPQLYTLWSGTAGRHTLELRFKKPGIRLYTFTFG